MGGRTTRAELMQALDDAEASDALNDQDDDLSDAERLALQADPPPINANRLGPDGLPVVRRQRPLTAHQMAFTQGVITGKSLRQAYRDAYGSSANDQTVSAAAGKLMRDPRIAALVQQAWTETAEHLTEDRAAAQRYVMRQLIALSKDAKQEGSRLKALELLGRSAGMFRDTVEQTQAAVSADVLKRQLQQHLRLLDTSRTLRATRSTTIDPSALRSSGEGEAVRVNDDDVNGVASSRGVEAGA